MPARFNLELLTPEYIKKISPYIPSVPDAVLQKRFNVSKIYRLNNNENPLGPLPAAKEALETFKLDKVSVYPSGDSFFLKEALAKKFNKSAERFLVGNGSNEAIACVVKAFCQQGDNIITADQTYATYEWIAEFSGIEPRLIHLDKNYRFDLQAAYRAINERTKIIFICNPNNPTNTWLSKQELLPFLEKTRDKIIVLDEAYCEFIEDPDFPDAMNLMEEYENIICFRTFSKMYGLAALRVGYLCGSEACIDMVRRAYVVYSVNSLAQIAAVQAINNDADHIQRTRAVVKESGAYVLQKMHEMHIPTISGPAFFFMAQMPIPDTVIYRRLIKQGIMVRTMTGFRFPNWIRVTYSTLDVMEIFVRALAKSL